MTPRSYLAVLWTLFTSKLLILVKQNNNNNNKKGLMSNLIIKHLLIRFIHNFLVSNGFFFELIIRSHTISKNCSTITEYKLML